MRTFIIFSLLFPGASYGACTLKSAESKAIASLKDFSGLRNINRVEKGTSINEDKSINVVLLLWLRKNENSKELPFVQTITYGRENCEIISSSSALVESEIALKELPKVSK